MSTADLVHRYFEEFISTSILQKAPGLPQYVMHDSIHDLAQLVSKDECFMIKDKSDLLKAPKNVRHRSIFIRNDSLDAESLALLCRYKKLRTIICNKALDHKIGTSLINRWCTELTYIRVLRFTNCELTELPKGIGKLKLLRYLSIDASTGRIQIPASFWSLYNLQAIYAPNIWFHGITTDIYKLINLRRFEKKKWVAIFKHCQIVNITEVKKKKRLPAIGLFGYFLVLLLFCLDGVRTKSELWYLSLCLPCIYLLY